MSSNGVGGLDNARKLLGRYGPAIGAFVVIGVLGILGLSKVGCGNKHTPPGHEGYVYSKPIAGAGEFLNTQKGPTSTGWVWRQDVINIDMRPRTYSEEMIIKTRKRLELKLRAHARIRINDGGVTKIVEQYDGEKWYASNVRGQFQGVVREIVRGLDPFDVKNQMRRIGDEVRDVLREKLKDMPITVVSVDIGDIQYPPTVVEAVITKFVTNEENERKDIELAIADQRRRIRRAKAAGTRDAQKIIRTTLDPMYLQYEAIQAIEKLSGSPNTTFLVMPFSEKGGAPIMLNLDK